MMDKYGPNDAQLMMDRSKADVISLIELVQWVNDHPDFFDTYARLYRSAYEALIRVGFSDEQAVKLARSMPVPC